MLVDQTKRPTSIIFNVRAGASTIEVDKFSAESCLYFI